MARVPTANTIESPAPGAIPGQLATRNVNLSADAFGAAAGRSMAQAGEQMASTANDAMRRIMAANKAEEALQAETLATERATAYSQQADAAYAEYAALPGQRAVDAFVPLQDRLRTLREQTLDGVDSPQARRMLTNRLASHETAVLAGAQRYKFQQSRAASVQASEGAAAEAINKGIIYRNEPARVDEALASGLTEVLKVGELSGWDVATLRVQEAAYRGRFYTGIIAATAETDPLAAQALFTRVRNGMDAATQVRVENSLTVQVRSRTVEGRLDNLLRPTPAGGDAMAAAFRAENPAGDARRNPTPGVTASGPGQINDGAWSTYAPRLGLRPDQRNDRAAHEQIWSLYQQDARRAVGRDLTPGEQYMAWGLGVAGAKAFIMAPRDANALEVYRSVAGASTADKAFRQNGDLLRPAMTVGQVADAFAARVGAVAPARRDRAGLYEAVMRQTEGDPDSRTLMLSRLNQRLQVEDAAMSQDRAAMDVRVRDLGVALGTGADVSIPEGEIRRLYQPAQAEAHLDVLYTQQVAGQLFRTTAFATPEDLRGMREDLTSGVGPISQALRERRRTAMNPDGTVVEAERAGDVATRAALARVFDERITARNTALNANPAGYVAADPTVRTAAQNITSDPATVTAYVTASHAAQTRLGITPANLRVLDKTQSEQIVERITRADPATADFERDLRRLRAEYGSHLPLVVNDLVRDGKLPRSYEVLFAIPTTAGRADYQRMLQDTAKAGGTQQLFNPLSTETRRTIRDDVDTATTPFRQSAMAAQNSGAGDLAQNVSTAVENLAMYYALRGASPSDALSQATARIITDRYDFVGTARVPAGRGAEVGRAMNAVRATLTPDMLQAPDDVEGASSMNDAELRGEALRAALRGQWVTNNRDNGLVLVRTARNGAVIPVRREDGSEITLDFNNLPTETVLGLRTPTMDNGGFSPPNMRTNSEGLPAGRPTTASETQPRGIPSRPWGGLPATAPGGAPVAPGAPAGLTAPGALPGQRNGPRGGGRWRGTEVQ